jgi:hypothetical protein
MGCGCGKKGNLPLRQPNTIKSAIQQKISRSIGSNNTPQNISNAPVGMDKNRLEMEKRRREEIRKSLGKMM